jgi:diacylglycerol kinase family enzyme
MVSVANTRQFGNNAFLAPAALPNDGKFDIVLLKPVPGLLLPVFLVRMVTGTLKESKYLHYIVSEGPVEISSPENRYHIDGEPVIFDEKVTVTIKRNALKVLKTRYNRWDKIN